MITVPSQHTESHVSASMAQPSITVAQLIRWSGLVNFLAGMGKQSDAWGEQHPNRHTLPIYTMW